MKWFKKIVLAIAISVAAYVGIALVLIATDRPVALLAGDEAIDFTTAISTDYTDLPASLSYIARDGEKLTFRLYGDPETSERTIILLHGSGWHGMQFHPMARHLAANAASLVAVPDLRGHGTHPPRRGDVDHIGQLEEDVADLIEHLSTITSENPLILGGHSSGGGLVVRFAGGTYKDRADGFILLAPFLKYDAPTTRPNSGGWAYPATRRIIGLTMLNAIGIRALNQLPVIAFAMPASVLEGPYGDTVTAEYSYRLNTSFAPRMDYEKDLAAMRQPFLLVAGTADEAFHASLYQPVISKWTGSGTYELVSEATHIDILTDPRAIDIVADWISAQ